MFKELHAFEGHSFVELNTFVELVSFFKGSKV